MIYKEAVSINLGSILTQKSFLKQPTYQLYNSKNSNYQPLQYLQKKKVISSLTPTSSYKQNIGQNSKNSSKLTIEKENIQFNFAKNDIRTPDRYSVNNFTKDQNRKNIFDDGRQQIKSQLFETSMTSMQNNCNKINLIPNSQVSSSKEKKLSCQPQVLKPQILRPYRYTHQHQHHKSQQFLFPYSKISRNNSANKIQKDDRLSITKTNSSHRNKKHLNEVGLSKNKSKPIECKRAICQALRRNICDSSLEIKERQNLLTLLDSFSRIQFQSNTNNESSFAQSIKQQSKPSNKYQHKRSNKSFNFSKNISVNDRQKQSQSQSCYSYAGLCADNCIAGSQQFCLYFRPLASNKIKNHKKTPKKQIKPKLGSYCASKRSKYFTQNDPIQEQQEQNNFNY